MNPPLNPNRADKRGHLRLRFPHLRFEDLWDQAFTSIRHYAKDCFEVTHHLMKVHGYAFGAIREVSHRSHVLRHAQLVEANIDHFPSYDGDKIREAYRALKQNAHASGDVVHKR